MKLVPVILNIILDPMNITALKTINNNRRNSTGQFDCEDKYDFSPNSINNNLSSSLFTVKGLLFTISLLIRFPDNDVLKVVLVIEHWNACEKTISQQ